LGPDSYLPMAGDWVDADNTESQCGSDGLIFNQYNLRSSDAMPANFQVFHYYENNFSEKSKWRHAFRNSIETLRQARREAGSKAFIPDILYVEVDSNGHVEDVVFPGSKVDPFCDGTESDTEHYAYNSSRIPWRMGHHYIAKVSSGGNPGIYARRAAYISSRIGAYIVNRIKSGGVNKVYAIRNVTTGNVVNGNKYDSLAFIGPYAVGISILQYHNNNMATKAQRQSRLNHFWDKMKEQQSDPQNRDYYGETLSLLSMLTISGNLWSPKHNYED